MAPKTLDHNDDDDHCSNKPHVTTYNGHFSLDSYQNNGGKKTDDDDEILLPLVATANNDADASPSITVISSQQRRRLLQGRILLFVVALIYGSLNVSLRIVYERPGPPTASAISTTRGWLAVLCFLPLFQLAKRTTRRKTDDDDDNGNGNGNGNPSTTLTTTTTTEVSALTDKDEYEKQVTAFAPTNYMFWRFALELAFFNFGTQGLINVGLVTIDSSARASFLTQLSVVITPVLSAIFGHKVHCRVWLACVLALGGLYILSMTGGGDADTEMESSSLSSSSSSIHLSTGDLCVIGAAFCWSYYIYRMSEWGDYFDEMQTQFWKNVFLASMYTVWLIAVACTTTTGSLWPGWRDWISWVTLFYSALFPCTIADILQQKAQAVVPAAESNVIMSLEPVFTAILGLLLLREGLAWQEIVGGGIIILASVLAST